MKVFLFVMFLWLATVAIAVDDKPDTLAGRWVVEVEDSTAVVRELTEDGWYTITISVPENPEVGKHLLVAKVRVLGRNETVEALQSDLEQTQSLLWQIKAKMDSTEKK